MTFATDFLGKPLYPDQPVITFQFKDGNREYYLGRVRRLTALVGLVVIDFGDHATFFRQSEHCLVVDQSLIDNPALTNDQVTDFLRQPLEHGDWILYLINELKFVPKRFDIHTDDPTKAINMVSFPKFTVNLLKNG